MTYDSNTLAIRATRPSPYEDVFALEPPESVEFRWRRTCSCDTGSIAIVEYGPLHRGGVRIAIRAESSGLKINLPAGSRAIIACDNCDAWWERDLANGEAPAS
jgi:hypothetical protein